ncbi:MAG TPA: hypothetical protein VMF08_15045 [Candidatus Sulfotelmatobacter sp.]|nr:hypothetical protein [Candidatus Sulfotelmatobacter sp.]
MKIGKWAGIMAGVVGLTISIHAQTQTYNAPEQAQTAPPPGNHWEQYGHLYHADELSVDLFGVSTLHSTYFNNGAAARRNLQFGGGAGVNYFLTRHLGIGGDFFAVNWHRSFVDTTTGNLIFRFPLGCGLAPYIFGGAGYQFEGVDQIVGGGGAGLELRLMPHFSIFVDARYLAAVKTRDYGVGRAGVRLSF